MPQRSLDLRTALGVLRRRWWLIVLIVALAALPTYLVSRSLPKVYEARTTLLVGLGLPGTSPDYQQLLASQRLSQTYASLATTSPVLEAVRSSLGLQASVDDLRRAVKATAPIDSTLITITATDGDPDGAARIADALAAELISRSPGISSDDPAVQRIVSDLLNADVENVQQQISASQREITRLAGLSSPTPDEVAQLTTLRAYLLTLQQAYATVLDFASGRGTNILTVVDPAQVPIEPASPRLALNTLIIALLALVNAIALAFLLEYLDDTLKSSEDAESLIGVPTIGTIPRMRLGRGGNPIYGLATLLYPRGAAAESFRTLRTNVDFANVDDPIRLILVTSTVPNEGKTTTAANLAVAIAQTGSNTILLDADLRRPGVHQMFALPNDEGLTSVLRPDGAPFQQIAKFTEQSNLRIITAGPLPPNPVEMLASRRMAGLLEALKERVDVVVIDSPPLQGFSDAAILSTLVDGTILVVSAGRTRRDVVRGAARTLAARGGRTLGVVLNRVRQEGEHEYYAYQNAYDASQAGTGGAAGERPSTSTAGVPAAGRRGRTRKDIAP